MTDPTSNQAADALTIARLAALSSLEYDRVRLTEAEALNCRVSTLDAMVESARAGERTDDALGDHRPPEFSDESLALRFSEKYADRLRYVADWGRWMIYDGRVWIPDNTMLAFNMARTICREASSACNDHDAANIIASARTIAAVEKLARADRRHAATPGQWDTNPWLLNTPAGAVDLRTGKIVPHDPGEHMTRMTAEAPAETVDCPIWFAFLDKVTGGNDVELRAYLRRVVGYSLTGITREHAMWFIYGLGGNGKGVFLNTMSALLANYAATAPMEAFTATSGERHPTDLAMLRGARLVTAQETEDGRRWAEARIKALTGGDPITARFMRQDFFTFIPGFKLVIAGNHKPGLRSVDEAIRRRLNLIPFTVQIPPNERDPELAEKLRPEWPAILKWAILGCLEWQKYGLNPPAAVLDATDLYLSGEDAMGLWLEERCIRADGKWCGSGMLFADWKWWAERAGQFVGTQKRFSQAIEARGLIPKREGGTGQRGFAGIDLNRPVPAAETLPPEIPAWVL